MIDLAKVREAMRLLREAAPECRPRINIHDASQSDVETASKEPDAARSIGENEKRRWDYVDLENYEITIFAELTGVSPAEPPPDEMTANYRATNGLPV